jgi:hypothetical protein
VTASAGVAGAIAESPTDVLSLAADALRQAKQSGAGSVGVA